jgi:hypothetical protein
MDKIWHFSELCCDKNQQKNVIFIEILILFLNCWHPVFWFVPYKLVVRIIKEKETESSQREGSKKFSKRRLQKVQEEIAPESFRSFQKAL